MKNSTQGVEIPAVEVRPPRFRMDRSAVLSFGTGELTTEHKMKLLDMEGLATLIVLPEDMTVDTAERIDAPFKEKSLSTRLRNVLYVYHMKTTNKPEDFESFYKIWMEKKIQEIKDQIPE